MGQLDKFCTFKELGKYYPSPVGYKKIWVHLVYDVKHDVNYKYSLVSDEHLTDISFEFV